MKRLITLSVAALVALVSSYASAETYNKVVYSTSTEITLGEWNCQYTIAKEYAEANNIPMILFWGNRGCSHCQSVEYSMGNTATASGQMFTEWQKTTGYVMVFVVNNAVGTNNNGVNDAMKAKNALGTGSYPLIGFYWKKPGSSSYSRLERLQGTVSAQKIIDTATKAFAGYEPQFNVMGKFDGSDAEHDRLEAEKAGTVPVRLTREKGGKAATGTLVVKNGSATVETKPVTWAEASGTKQEQYVDITVPAGLTAGKTLTLELKNADGEVEQTASVHYVAPANAVANPLWIGEKTSTELKFGEWTMDLDVAKQKVAATGGSAYTLVCVQGSQWCPDCGNVEKNFLDVKRSGANAFAKWAESKNVALVAIDIPNFKSASVDAESPCLLKRDAFETHPEGGDYALHSGLAYLTRKGVSAADAAARGHDMVMTPNALCYLSYPQFEKDDPYPYYGVITEKSSVLTLERAYSFDPVTGVPESCRSRIIGGQASCWSESTFNVFDLEWKTWPRACAIAEVLWTNPVKRDFAAFRGRLSVHRRRLVEQGVNCAPVESENFQ